ncbi:septal ring lytic transglycosylase RlpA family protein [Flavobacterium rhizosphaerae]|uniref:Probable endolytic peptidoglycan transglycosylase RlpA n=1 Tax=Flavobacterium rhizosphaerae TaxID=3163298 RepID=A0ABW8Z115_9FLAO
MKRGLSIISVLLLVMLLSAFSSGGSCSCNANKNPEVTVVKDTLKEKEPQLTLYKQNVFATYYADRFNGKKTSSGERFNNTSYTAAHKKLPFGTLVRVTNEANGKWVDIKINDRGPFGTKHEIDLTKKAFMEIASDKGSGHMKVKIEIIEKE